MLEASNLRRERQPAGFDRPHSDARAMKVQGKGLFGNREGAAGFAWCGGRFLALPRPRRAKARGVLSHCPTVAPRQQGGAQHLRPATNHQNIASPREGLLRWHDGYLGSMPAAAARGAGVLQPRSRWTRARCVDHEMREYGSVPQKKGHRTGLAKARLACDHGNEGAVVTERDR
jgi:hypothetical protein